MKFKQEMVFTGVETNISKKTGNEYRLVKLLDKEGNQIVCLVEKIQSDIKMLQEVEVDFELKVGKYIQLKALEVKSND